MINNYLKEITKIKNELKIKEIKKDLKYLNENIYNMNENELIEIIKRNDLKFKYRNYDLKYNIIKTKIYLNRKLYFYLKNKNY